MSTQKPAAWFLHSVQPETRPLEVGETIETGDTCNTTEGHRIPAANSIGRKVRQENFGWVHTTRPHTPETLKLKETRLRTAPTETYEVSL